MKCTATHGDVIVPVATGFNNSNILSLQSQPVSLEDHRRIVIRHDTHEKYYILHDRILCIVSSKLSMYIQREWFRSHA